LYISGFRTEYRGNVFSVQPAALLIGYVIHPRELTFY
jgi:hypothetical protein